MMDSRLIRWIGRDRSLRVDGFTFTMTHDFGIAFEFQNEHHFGNKFFFERNLQQIHQEKKNIALNVCSGSYQNVHII